MRTIIGLLFLCLLAVPRLHAQDWTPPTNVKLEKAEDYKTYEKDVLAAIGWLENTPVGKETEKRKQAGAFLMQWITGSPDVSVELNGNVVTFMNGDNGAHLLLAFMGGWTRYALTDAQGGKDTFQGNLAGLKSVIHLYRDTGGLQKDKEVEKLVKLDKGGKLEDWLREQLQKKS